MELEPSTTSLALFQSLLHGPLLLEDLPEAQTLNHSCLKLPASLPELNLQQKLGHLYEDALSVLLRSSPEFDLLEENLQVQADAHTTVGELDFLIQERGNAQLIHLELATKFYLAVETADGIILPGPDARDNYHKKLARLREHQLRLTHSHRHYLPERYRGETIETKQLVYGCLFDHVDATEQATPEFVNPHCRRGRWVHEHECGDYFPRDTHFQIIPKPLWPVPLEFLEDIPLASWSPDQSIDRCLMVRVPNERTPHFVAPSGYPRT